MMAANYLSSKETTNFSRICRLVIDVIPDLFRDLLNIRLPASGLSAVLTIQKRKIFSVLVKHQKNFLYPGGGVYQGSVKDLNISLLYILLRNIGNIPPHQNGWGKEPDIADRSLSANIDRLRKQYNVVFAHTPNASLSDGDFQAYWDIIRQSVEEIQNSELNTRRFVVAVDEMLTMEMDHRMTNKYIEELLLDMKGAKHYNIASNQDIPEEAIDIHNKMVNYLDECIYEEDLIRLRELFKGIPFSPVDMLNIHNIYDIFRHLINKEIISIGSYTKFISNLRHINPMLATYVEKEERDMQEIFKGADMSTVREYVSVLRETLDVAATDSRQVRGNMAGMSVKQDAIQTDMAGLSVKQDAMQTDMAGMSVKQDAMQTDMADLQGMLAGMSVKQDTMQTDMADLHDDVSEVKEDVKTLKDDSSTVKEDVGAIKEDVGAVKEDVGAVKEDVGAVKEDISSIKDILNNLSTGTNHIKGDVEAVSKNVGAVRNDVSAVWDDVSAVWDDVSALRDDVSAMRDDVGAVRDAVGALRDDVGAVRDDVGAVRDDVGAVRDDVGAVRDDVGALRDDVGAVRDDDGAVWDDVSAVRDDVGAVRDDVGAVRDDVGALRDDFRAVRDDVGAVRDDVRAVRDYVRAVEEQLTVISADRDGPELETEVEFNQEPQDELPRESKFVSKLEPEDLPIPELMVDPKAETSDKPEIVLTENEDTYSLLAQKYNLTDDCVVPVKDASNQEELIIIYDPSCNTERKLKEFGHNVMIRNQKYVSNEGAVVSSICKNKQYPIRPEDKHILKQVLNHHAKRLFASHSNLNIITTSPVKSKKKGDDISERPCIVLVCSSKGYIPKGESKFPEELIFENTSIVVDVREGYFQFCPTTYPTFNSSLFHQNIKMGCSFGIEGTHNAGTVGPFVDIEGHQLFLTCAHIVNGVDPKGYDLNNIQDMFAEQPDAMTYPHSQTPGYNTRRCGEVRRALFSPNNDISIDAAVVEITEQSRIPSRGEFAIDSERNLKAAGFEDMPRFESGDIHVYSDKFDTDLRIIKFGATTHATRGVISSYGTFARALTTDLGLQDQPDVCVMKNQMEVYSLQGHSNFFLPGDSGSGVFVVNKLPTGEQNLTCIGLAIGSTSYGSAVVTPIAAVLDALELPKKLKQFP